MDTKKKIKTTNLDREFFFNNLFRIGYPKRLIKDLSKEKYLNCIIKAFQRRYRQDLTNGAIDRECLLISQSLLKKFC